MGTGRAVGGGWSHPPEGPLCWAVGAPDPLSTWRGHTACTGCHLPRPGWAQGRAARPGRPVLLVGWEGPREAWVQAGALATVLTAIPTLRSKPPSLPASDLVLELLAHPPPQPPPDHPEEARSPPVAER